jgi:kynurenine formamidase
MCQHDRLMEAARQFRELGSKLSNWGRWGAEDRIGTLNHITPARRLAAREEIRQGRAINLGLPISADGIQIGMGGRINPVHLMSMTHIDLRDRPDGWFAADDFIFMPLQSVTQWDGLGHVGYDDRLYNDVPADSLTTAGGSLQLSITQVTEHGIAGRGVLLDIARLRGVDRMAAGEEITPEDLEAAEARQGVRVGPGDVLLVRTGWLRNFTVDGDARAYWNGEPGLTLECAEWLHAREVAAIASDNWAVEVQQADLTDFIIPFHCVTIRDMGLTLGEIFVLDELADACAEAGRWSFFFSAPALPVVGGVGSPIAPLAIL